MPVRPLGGQSRGNKGANLTAKPFIMRLVLGLIKPKQIIVGTDFAGEVVSIGKKIKALNVGDKVFGFKDSGLASQAEYLTTTAENSFTIPENVDLKTSLSGV